MVTQPECTEHANNRVCDRTYLNKEPRPSLFAMRKSEQQCGMAPTVSISSAIECKTFRALQVLCPMGFPNFASLFENTVYE